MTDRIRSLVVILDEDTRTDDAEPLINAIRQLRGVQTISHGPVVDFRDHIARRVARSAIIDKLIEVVKGE